MSGKLEAASLVVVARLDSTETGAKGTLWQEGHPESIKPISITLLHLTVLQTVKGLSDSNITVAVPSTMLDLDNTDEKPYPGILRTKGIWFLQKKSASGTFSQDFSIAEPLNTYRWSVEGEVWSPLRLRAAGSFVSVETFASEIYDEAKPQVRLMAILAANAALRSKNEYGYLNLLIEICPAPQPGNSLEEMNSFQTFMDDAFPKIFAPQTDTERLNLLAIKARMGEPGKRQIQPFLDLFERMSWSDLHVPMPPIDDAATALSVLPRIPDPDVARSYFIGLGDHPELAPEILKQALSRIGIDHWLDAGILECAAKLLNRPDLSPFGPSGVLPDLSEKLQLLKNATKSMPPPVY